MKESLILRVENVKFNGNAAMGVGIDSHGGIAVARYDWHAIDVESPIGKNALL